MLTKKYKTILLIFISMLIGIIATIIILPFFNDATISETQALTERKILFWYDPMYPNQKFDKPGPSPFMDMDLVAKYADEADLDVAGVTINPTQVQNLGIRTAIAEVGKLSYNQTLPANIIYNQYQYEIVHARASGFVEKSYPLAVGDYVEQGDPLVDITVSDWVAAQSEYLTLLRNNASPTLLKGVRDRLYLAGMSNELLDKLDKTKQIQSYLTIRAPMSGVLTSFDVRSGMTINKSATIGTIQGMDPIWVTASLPESLADLLTNDTALTVAVSAFPDKQFPVIDWKILANAQSDTRTLTLRLTVDHPLQQLKPGMSASVQLHTQSAEYLLIPSQAVIDTGEQQRVITQDESGRFIPKQVKVYREANGKTAILSGLQVGEKVVTSGVFLIDSEANINGALERMQQGAN